MQNVFSYIRECRLFKTLSIDELLFVEFKCLVEELKHGMWSDANYFVFVTNGKKKWSSLDQEYIVTAGDALFVKKGANIAHQFHSEDYCALMIFMPDDFIQRFMTKFKETVGSPTIDAPVSDSVMRITVDDFLTSYVQSLEAYFITSPQPNKNILQLKFEELLLNIFTRPAHQDIANYFKLLNMDAKIQLEQIMRANFAYNLKLNDYAHLCSMSLSSFKRTFKQVFNTSPGKWLCKKKVTMAERLLKTSDKTIGQVAFDTGFEDTSHFIKVFKQEFGSTPLKYRNEYIQGES